MAIKRYGVWVGSLVRMDREANHPEAGSAHVHLLYDDGSKGQFEGLRRASINVRSKGSVSDLVYWYVPEFKHPITGHLKELRRGLTRIAPVEGGLALDYLRGDYFDLGEGWVLPHDEPGHCNDILDHVLPELEHAIQSEATAYLFGEPYDNLQGMHNLHMNQGSVGRFRRLNGTWQDGAVILRYRDHFSAIFLAFASQAVQTHGASGNPVEGAQNFAKVLAGRIPPMSNCRVPREE